MTDQTTPEPLTDAPVEHPLSYQLLADLYERAGIQDPNKFDLDHADLQALFDEIDWQRSERNKARTESLTLGVSLAETIQERQKLRTRLADAEQTRRAALAVAADLTEDLAEARAEAARAWSEGHAAAMAAMLDERDSLAAKLDAVRELHTLERRYTDEHAESSYDTQQEAADALGIAPDEAHPLDVCSYCGSIEMDSGAEDYHESLWPCPTIRALDGDGVTAHSVLGIAPAKPRHFAPSGAFTTCCGETIPQDTPWEPSRGDWALATLTTRRASTTCQSCINRFDSESAGLDNPAPLTLAQAATALHDWAGDLAGGTRTDWPAGHPDIIHGIRAAADWLDARDRYENDARDARAARLRETGRRLGESFQQLGDAIRDGAAKARAAREQTAEQPDVDGWTIYPTTDGGLMVSHDTDADQLTLTADGSIPLGSVLAFIADADVEPAEDHRSGCCGTCDAIHADREAREAEPAEMTLRDVMAAAHRAGLGIRRDGDYIACDGIGEAWAYVEWSIVNGHGREVGRLTIRRTGAETAVQLDSRRSDRVHTLIDPAPADILAAAREAGLIGDTDA